MTVNQNGATETAPGFVDKAAQSAVIGVVTGRKAPTGVKIIEFAAINILPIRNNAGDHPKARDDPARPAVSGFRHIIREHAGIKLIARAVHIHIGPGKQSAQERGAEMGRFVK